MGGKTIIKLILMSLLLVSCAAAPQDSDKLQVLTTTNIVGDLVSVIGGDHVEVTSMMQAGVDPHTYKAKPSDVRAIQNADIIAFNGVTLEAKLAEVLAGLDDLGKNVINLEMGIDPEKILVHGLQNGQDPHIWFDVTLWKDAAIHVAARLSKFDPDSEKYYHDNLARYLVELDHLDQYIFNRIEEIPEPMRVLITAHDAFMYFSHRYGVEVRAIQGINTQSEAGIKDIHELANFIVERKIRTVFPESSVPTKTVESLIEAVQDQGTSVEMGDELYSDSLRDNSSYIETFKANVDNIVDSLK